MKPKQMTEKEEKLMSDTMMAILDIALSSSPDDDLEEKWRWTMNVLANCISAYIAATIEKDVIQAFTEDFCKRVQVKAETQWGD